MFYSDYLLHTVLVPRSVKKPVEEFKAQGETVAK